MSNPTVKLVWTGPKRPLEAAQTYLSEFVEGGALSFRPAPGEDGLAPTDGSPEADAGHWLLEFYAEADADVGRLRAGAAAFAEELGEDWSEVLAAPPETLPDVDWVQYSLDGLGLVEIGRFLLYGVHDEAKIAGSGRAYPIRIDANQAFGTGHHPTTFGCLTMLDRFAGAPPSSVLDLGCGSGVLAIAASKLWDMEVLGVDIDPTSVDIARENAALNGVADRVRVLEADGPDHTAVASAAPFDFVFANILAGPLIEFAPGMARIVVPRGRVLLAGLMAEQEAAVAAAYEAAGFRRINRLPAEAHGPDGSAGQHPVWPILLFVRL